MSTRPLQIGACAMAVAAAGALAQRADCETELDALGDSVLRRTDHGNDGPLHPGQRLPDVLGAAVCGWQPHDPADDPYSGHTVDADDAHIFRLEVRFAGLVNPPGPVGIDGGFDPFRFGDSPVVGFLDLDVDREADTGGELGSAAEQRYLANVARFARVPHGDLLSRVARERSDLDSNFGSPPQYERSGADFSLVMCGCFEPEVVELAGNGDGRFDAGETWLVRGRFFERARGYRDASAAYGGSAPGLYDPELELRFEHDVLTDETTITLVWALDPRGAADLAGEPNEGIDLDVSNHTSVAEALQDIIDGADGDVPYPARELVREWRGEDAWDHLRVTDWRDITGLFGVPYAQEEPTLYAWTDTMGEAIFADLNGDEYVNSVDEQLVRQEVYTRDGGTDDADSARNGVFVLRNPGWNFSLFDTNGDMRLDLYDFEPYGPLGDFDGSGTVNTQDFIAFLNAWAARQPSADFNLDQKIDTLDFISFLNEWVQG